MVTRQQIRVVGLLAGPGLFFLILVIPVGLPSLQAKVVLASAVWMAGWWITEAIPLYATSLLPLVLFPLFGIATFSSLSSSYADRIIFLFLGGFVLAAAIQRSGLHERFALYVIKLFGVRQKRVVGGFMMTTAVLSAWVSNTATTMMMLPIAASVVAQVQDGVSRSKFGTCLMLSIAYSANIGGLATLIGTPPNAVFVSLAQSLAGVTVSFERWMLVGVPVAAIMLSVTWWYLVNIGAKVGNEPVALGKEVILKKLAGLGGLSRREKTVAVIFGATVAAWITRGLFWGTLVPSVDDATIAVVASIALLAAPAERGEPTLDWESVKGIPWGVLLLFGGGLALAAGFTSTGLDAWIADRLLLIHTTDLLVILPVIAGFVVFSGEIMSNTAGAALVIPVGAKMASSLGIAPLLVMLPVALASSLSFILPVGTPPNAIVFGSGHVTSRQMAKAGLPLDLLGIVVVTLAGALLVPLVWG